MYLITLGDTRLPGNKKPLTSTQSVSHAYPPQPVSQKKALSRTRSLVPGNFNDKNTGVNRSLSPGLLVPSGPIHGVADVEKSNKRGHSAKKGHYSSPRRSPSPRAVSPRGQQDRNLGSSLKVPLQSTETLAVMHETLRPVHSDPTSGHLIKDTSGRSGPGEYMHLKKPVTMTMSESQQPNQMYNRSELHKSASIGSIQQQQHMLQSQLQQDDTHTVHKTLERQLSLTGAHDPRINNRSKQQLGNNKPIVKFHGKTIPTKQSTAATSQFTQQQQPATWGQFHSRQHPAFAVSNQMPLVYHNVRVHIEQDQMPEVPPQLLGYNSKVAGAEFHSQQVESLKPPEVVKSHTPLGRMSSAPDRFGQSATPGDNSQSSDQVVNTLTPTMNRLNSTSDSQLNVGTERGELSSDSDTVMSGVWGDPRWAFQGSISGMVMEQVERHKHQEKWDQLAGSEDSNDVFYIMPDGSQQKKQGVQYQPSAGIKVAFGQVNTPWTGVNRMGPAKQVKDPVDAVNLHKPRKEMIDERSRTLGTHTQSTAGCVGDRSQAIVTGSVLGPQSAAGCVGDRSQVSVTGPVLEPQSIIASMPLEQTVTRQTTEQLTVGQSLFGGPANMPTTLVDISHKKNSVVTTPQKPAEHGSRLEQGYGDLLADNEKRTRAYFHLCGIFNEDKVRQVMAEHPEETDPKNLCKYLLAMN